ncbi:MAG: hypothetical protein JWQ94_3829 [Tardiphaga sp.]|nr:hypothetical protein [Tardiphaga sp.]
MAKAKNRTVSRSSQGRAGARNAPPRTTAEQRGARGATDSPLPADTPPADVLPTDQIAYGSRVFSAAPTKLGGRKLDILPDMPDIRDRPYVPHLRALQSGIYPRIAFSIRNQGNDDSCTGFSLAHVVDFLRFREISAESPQRVSARMLYEMAKRNDEWDGTTYNGSSIRGAIKGFFRNGVCTDRTAPDRPGDVNWTLTYDMAKEARQTRLGAYLRLQPDLTDYHAALNEVGVIYVSAQIHTNWKTPVDGAITPGGAAAGGHAFAIVGYDQDGFWVLNSWGAEWGRTGIAHWDYIDWANSVMDAWVLQLGVPAPKAFGAIPRAAPASSTGGWSFADPNRADIIGHFLNIDDGRLVTDVKYGSPQQQEMQQTVDRLLDPNANKGKGYEHLVIYVHGGLNSLTDEAKRIATWQRNDIFGRNRIYNFHLMWGSGFIDEVFGRMLKSQTVGGAGSWSADWLFEAGPGKETGAYAWRNMKQDGRMAFDLQARKDGYDGGEVGLAPLFDGISQGRQTAKGAGAVRRPKLHLVGHSAGAVVIGYLLSALSRFNLKNIELGGIHLMAPACTVPFFTEHYSPYLTGNKLTDKVYLYNLRDAAETADTVESSIPLTPYYSHSLLYLVSRAFEDRLAGAGANSDDMPLAGMEKFVKGMPTGPKLQIDYATPGGTTTSTSHGGFDNDVATLSSIMSRILGKKVEYPPQKDELVGY